ncbi:sugar ABC transporter ATP-binding protein [Rhodobacteraceae bacterium KMM 6894]|nr:sugar ABC transporter ATP-binding protein [Rhodobacteraceae bacterium KMM 6894]
MSESLVELKGASKIYEGNYAIRNVDFTLKHGEIHALLGENGAGKSTLCKIIAGVTELSEGELKMDGEPAHFTAPSQALSRGVMMVYQETSLVPGMTVAQNIVLGKENILNRLRGLEIMAQQLLRSMNFYVDPTKTVSQLTSAQKQMVEIARAVHHGARIIIFDEPTATLTPEEKLYFFAVVDKLRKQGVSMIYISHALEEALEISDRISILRDGELVKTANTSDLDRDTIVRNMVGRDLASPVSKSANKHDNETAKARKPVLKVENVIYGNVVKNMSFSVFPGEITCIGGLIGSGRTEIAQVICGEVKRNILNGGMIYLNDKPIRYTVPAQGVRDGIAYVTEDRKLNGFFETMDIAQNIYIGRSTTPEYRGLRYSEAVEETVAEHWIKKLQIRAIGKKIGVKELSGGNQQKVVIAKSMVQEPELIIFDEPTRGVDVGAIDEIHAAIRQLANSGVAVIVISSYLPELLSLGDRILVAKQGRIIEEFSPETVTEEAIMHAAIH